MTVSTESSEYKLNDVDVPHPKGYEYLIKIGAAGFCHTVRFVDARPAPQAVLTS